MAGVFVCVPSKKDEMTKGTEYGKMFSFLIINIFFVNSDEARERERYIEMKRKSDCVHAPHMVR